MNRTYVKTGFAGYGPDLDTEDTGYDTVSEICAAIRWELDSIIDGLSQEWSAYRDADDADAYMAARELADELDNLAANLDYDRRATAPLYVDNSDKLDESMRALIGEHFPLDVTTTGNVRLYVWEADDES